MDFSLNEEQLALQGTAAAVFRHAYGDYARRRDATETEAGFDRAFYRKLGELGFLGLHFAEEVGGSGAGFVEAGLIARELGRVVAPEPYVVSAVLAGSLVSAVGTAEQQTTLVRALSAGDLVLAFAHSESGHGWSPMAEAVVASEADGSWTLNGAKEPVPFGAEADLLVVSAAVPGSGTGLFLVTPGAPGLARTGFRTVGGGRVARIVLDSTPADRLGSDTRDSSSDIATAIDVARVVSGQEALGAMHTALATTTAYLKQRRQFGTTLNAFQALTFRAADMYVEVELTESLVQWATMVLADGNSDAIGQASARAGLQVARASRLIAQESIQLHGGIGMTAEYSVGAYAQRLVAIGQLFGIEEWHLGRLANTVTDYAILDPLS